jgi:hypothetical protein
LLLPEDFADQWKTASETLQKAAESKERFNVKLDTLNKESDILNVRDDLLKNEDAILMLYKDLGAVERYSGPQCQDSFLLKASVNTG